MKRGWYGLDGAPTSDAAMFGDDFHARADEGMPAFIRNFTTNGGGTPPLQ